MNKELIIEKTNKLAYDYLVNVFASQGILCKTKSSKSFNILYVEVDESQKEIFLQATAKAIVLSNKYEQLKEAFEDVKLSYAVVACMSALLYFDIEREINKVIPKIENMQKISLEGVFNFYLLSLKEDWEELKNIGSVLTYNDERDIYNVTTFIMSNRTSTKSLFLAEYPDILLANVTDGLMVENFCLHHRGDFDLISLLVAENPVELIIEKNQLEEPLLDCLNKLVKVKVL